MSVAHWHDFDRGHLRRSVLRFAAGGVFICVAHAAVVWGALFFRPTEPAADSPPAAMMIELAPLAVSAPSEIEEVAPGPQMVQSEEVVSNTTEEVEEVEPPPEPPEPTPTPVEKVVTPEPPPTEQAVAEEVAEPLPAPSPSEVVLPLPKPAEMKTEKVEKPPEKPRKVERDAKPKPRRRRVQAATTSAPPRSAAPRAQTTAAPSAGANAVSSTAIARWRAMALAHLMRYQRAMPGHRGRVVLYMSLSGSGAVRSVRVIRSSSDPALDRQAEAMVRRASPFPAPPGGQPLNVSAVPINFVER